MEREGKRKTRRARGMDGEGESKREGGIDVWMDGWRLRERDGARMGGGEEERERGKNK